MKKHNRYFEEKTILELVTEVCDNITTKRQHEAIVSLNRFAEISIADKTNKEEQPQKALVFSAHLQSLGIVIASMCTRTAIKKT